MEVDGSSVTVTGVAISFVLSVLRQILENNYCLLEQQSVSSSLFGALGGQFVSFVVQLCACIWCCAVASRGHNPKPVHSIDAKYTYILIYAVYNIIRIYFDHCVQNTYTLKLNACNP